MERTLTMPKPVQGFLTSDGRFFASAPEARYEEAKSKLLSILAETYDSAAAYDVLTFFAANKTEILEYLNAYSETSNAEGAKVSETNSESETSSKTKSGNGPAEDGSFEPEFVGSEPPPEQEQFRSEIERNRISDAPKPKRLKPRSV